MIFDDVETYSPKDAQIKFNTVRPVWELDLFGGREIRFPIITDVSWRKRVVTKLLLGSKWTRIKK